MDRIHPESMRELSMLIQLHGAARVKAAVDEIAARLSEEWKDAEQRRDPSLGGKITQEG